MAKKTQREDKVASENQPAVKGRALVIVESPAKAKTINKYLGKQFVVKACKGHVRDLPPHQYGIDPGKNFEPTYELLTSHRKIVAELKGYADEAETVYLATDLDREGEAIAWHLAQALELPASKIRRVVFNEITESAIVDAFKHPHEINIAKVDAQQARRILDRVVGYELSPLLWKKVAKGLSAGRVQSVAVRLIVDREGDIRRFEPQEYWEIDGVFGTAKDQIEQLSKEWRKFIVGHPDSVDADGDGEVATQKERMAWMADRGCFESALHEFNGTAFKPLGRIERGKGDQVSFHSAIDEVRPIAEAIGANIEKVETQDWEEYKHLSLQKSTMESSVRHGAAPQFVVKSIETKRSKVKPPGPFTTATIQQAAANQLRMSASKTMRTAQGLYEGVDIKTGEGNVGLITYMRTDSTNLSADSIQAVRKYITSNVGDKYVPDQPNRYGSSKQAQEAHEAIRPTDVTRTPEAMRGHLTPEQHKLYTLIWNRFVACQMVPAEWDGTTILVAAKTPKGEAVFKATGRVLVFDGFYKVVGVPKSSEDQTLPKLDVGQRVWPIYIQPTQKFTSPPPRFTEASLVKELESEGIGRPSTYASIIQTIQDRGYVEQLDRRFNPTSRGEVVTEKLVKHFPRIMDVGFTSHVEGELDKIEESHLDWHDVLHEFYDPFKELLAKAHEEMDAIRAEPSEYVCPDCGKPMVYRMGKNGRFLACTGYPECKVARDVDKNGKLVQPVMSDVKCALCGKQMAMRRSKIGPFLGCTGYPECNYTLPCMDDGTPLKKVKAEEIETKCPDCGGPMQVKFARGRSFLGCANYPKCKATAPMPEGIYVEKPKPESAGVRCDKCGRDMVIRKSRRGPFLSCLGFPKCRNAMPVDKLDHLKALEAEGKIPDAPIATAGGKKAKGRGKAVVMTKEEVAALGTPPAGFAWTRTGRPVVENWPEEPLKCFQCGEEMILRTGRFGPFYSCTSNKCKTVANLRGEAKKRAETESGGAPARPKPIETDVNCPDCGKKMLLRMGRSGRFLGCSDYPKCKKTMEPPAGMLRELAETTA